MKNCNELLHLKFFFFTQLKEENYSIYCTTCSNGGDGGGYMMIQAIFILSSKPPIWLSFLLLGPLI